MNNNIQAYVLQIKDVNLVDIIQSQSLEIVNELFIIYANEDRLKTQLNTTDHDGNSPLHKACTRGYIELIDFLLHKGCNSNAKNNNGETPAHIASKRGSSLQLRLLLEYGADMTTLDNKGRSISHLAIHNDSVGILAWLEGCSSDYQFMLNLPDNNEITPLHLCCILNKVNCLKFLLKKSRSQLSQTVRNTRDTCLHLAIFHRSFQCIPIILFHQLQKKSLCNYIQEFHHSEPSLMDEKNALKKTPMDLFNEWPDKVKSNHRQFYFAFFALTFMPLSSLRLNIRFYRFFLFVLPILFLLISAALSEVIFPKYGLVIMAIFSFVTLLFVQNQTHRVNELDNNANPIFAGGYLAGIISDLFTYFYIIYPTLIGNEWQVVLGFIFIPCLILAYLRIVSVESGKVNLTDIELINFSQFIDNLVIKKRSQNLPITALELDRFCLVCEASYKQERVKHCKICEDCFVNMDHHCLFLMRCIAKNNLRNFVVLVFLSFVLILIYINLSVIYMTPMCGKFFTSSPVYYIKCVLLSKPYIACGLLFNIPSAIWAFYVLYYQLSVIGYNSTYYFYSRYRTSASFVSRMYRIFYFLMTGNFYERNVNHCV